MLRHPWLLWLVAVIALVGYPISSMLYYSQLLASGVLPVDKDSIGIPIFSDFVTTAILTPIVLTVTGLVLRGYDGTARLLAWDSRRPIRSTFFTAAFGLPAAFAVFALGQDLIEPRKWWEIVSDLFVVPILTWLVMVRAVLVSPRSTTALPDESTP